ncbi:MAG TPA: phosphopantothenoylcysteine decarboxylase [Candidatus Omnitrophota bacterium]|nr:phosphopantothenoylcysteine decarboxylase [Candidatus Omnitrophota bacterium]HPN66331.1 phosphopantothenoylcysteine decarboxylase [Candidatus Omnitrophota bacterium]HRZ67096.1 phosphopantothenoylcysteine decarboxylase [Candidatus Omnitrophota bacterium]
MRILVTAGPTREFLDPIRYISNSSTGYFGYRIAEEAIHRGHEVVLVSGPVAIDPPLGARFIPVVSALEMEKAVKKHFFKADCLIMTAAVADYRPVRFSKSKIKKRGKALNIKMRLNPDILSWAGRNKGKRKVIGFALETENTVKNALKKMKAKNADLLFAIRMGGAAGPFGDRKIRVICLKNAARPEGLLSAKDKIARFVLDKAENG